MVTTLDRIYRMHKISLRILSVLSENVVVSTLLHLCNTKDRSGNAWYYFVTFVVNKPFLFLCRDQ